MAITASELIVRRALTNNDTTPSSNGGEMSTVLVTSGAINNVFPNTSQTDRLAGITRYRKIFLKNHSAEDLALTSTKIFMDNITPAEDTINFLAGDYVDTEDGIVGTELFGCGILSTDATAGATQITVTVEGDAVDADLVIFRDTGSTKIRITDKQTANGVGNEEYVDVTSVVSLSASVATLNITPALANTYSSTLGVTRVMSVYEPGDLDAAITNFSTAGNSGTGTLNSSLVETGIRGALNEAWELRFTSATAFQLWNDGVQTAFSGTVGSDFTPSTPRYFRIPTGAWGGAFVATDVVSFDQVPAAAPVWLKQEVQAGATSYSANTVPIVMDGESA